MTPSTISGRGLFSFFQWFFMTAYALPVKGLLKMEPGGRSVAERTADLLVSLHQLTFIEDILSFLIEMMAVLTGQPPVNMEIVGKVHWQPFLCRQIF
jgi:hypothetical protein